MRTSKRIVFSSRAASAATVFQGEHSEKYDGEVKAMEQLNEVYVPTINSSK